MRQLHPLTSPPVRFGTIPTTDDGDPRTAAIGWPIETLRASFEANQEITIKHAGRPVRELPNAKPSYTFQDPTHCADFIARVRNRELVDTFRPTEIWYCPPTHKDVEERASLKVCRIWRRGGVRGATRPPEVTITYADHKTNKYVEHDLAGYRAALPKPKNKKKLWLVELTREADRKTALSFRFQESQCEPIFPSRHFLAHELM